MGARGEGEVTSVAAATGTGYACRRLMLARTALAIVSLVSSTYFFAGGGWNQASHFALVRAITERAVFHIDATHGVTGDKSLHAGHYYTNKAPGTALAAVPGVLGVDGMARLLGADPVGGRTLLWKSGVATFCCGALPTLLAVLVVFEVALKLGMPLSAALAGALTFFFASPAWIYSANFWAHPLTMGCLALALGTLILPEKATSNRARFIRGVIVGFSLGWSILTEYSAAGATVLLLIFGVWRSWKEAGTRGCAALASGVLAGGILPGSLFALYHTAAFGSAFRLSYSADIGNVGLKEGVLGFTLPAPATLAELLFGTSRGLFPLSPVLLAAPAGWVLLFKSKHGGIALLGTAGFLYFLLINASFHYWWAGWTTGPRYMAAGLPFLLIGFAPVFQAVGRSGRWLLGAVAGAGALGILSILSTNPFPPETLPFPRRTLNWPAFVEGRLSLNEGAYFWEAPTRAFNLGEGMGLRGLPSLLPLILFWILLAGVWIWQDRRLAKQGGGPG